MAWYDHYFTEEWEKRFRVQARNLFSKHPDLIGDAFQSAWLKLFENLKKSRRHDISDAYVMTSFKNLLRDEYRHHFGRCRPKSWVKKLGFFWERVAVVLCQENLPAQDIAKKVSADFAQQEDKQAQIAQIEEVLCQLKAKPYCSTIGSREQQAEEDKEYSDERDMPNNNLSQNELRLLVQIILGGTGEAIEQTALSEHIIQQWQPLSQALSDALSDDDRLVLTLTYSEGYSLPKVAKSLHKTLAQIRYQLKQALSTILSILEQHELNLDLLTGERA